MLIKNYPETIWLPKDTQVVADSYQVRYGTINPYSAPMSVATLATTYGIVLNYNNYVYARDPNIEYTDFQLLTGENGVTYPQNNESIYIKFKVQYPNLKQVYIVFIIKTSVPA
jgi:hypothetical protein